MNLASRSYQEKRNYIRMKVETPIDLVLREDQSLQGICHNLSGGGMLISLSSPVPVGTELQATVSSNHGHNPMLTARVRVNRVESNPSQTYQLGLEIIRMLD